jgi:nitroreductase
LFLSQSSANHTILEVSGKPFKHWISFTGHYSCVIQKMKIMLSKELIHGKEPEMSDFFELLKKRRSIRDFDDKDVPLEIINEIIKESCMAPSSANGQPWRFIIVNNKDVIKSLSDDSKKNIISEIEMNPESPLKKYEEALRSPGFNVFYNAPCLVFIVGPKHVRTLYVDCSLAACYFMFSASARNLGTCWIGLGTRIQDPALLELMGMPEDHKIVAPLILGYPKGIPNQPERFEPHILKIVS